MASERMDPKVEKGEVSWAEHYARYIFASQFVSEKKVLDVSCGSGYGSFYLAEIGKAEEVIGVDISTEAIEFSKKNFKSKKVNYLKMDAQDMKFKENYFDVIVSYETIEHLPESKKFLEGVKKFLKKDGLFIVSSPNKKVYPSGNPFHVKEYTYQEFNSLLKIYFKEIEFLYQDNWVTSGILKEKTVVSGDLSKEIDLIDVYKLTGRDFLDSLYFITLCSDAKIQNYKQSSALYAFTLGINEWMGQLASHEEQFKDKIEKLDSELNGVRLELKDTKERLKNKTKDLESILNSKRWRLVEAVAKVKRSVTVINSKKTT